MRIAVLGVIFVLVVGGVLYGAWSLDSGSRKEQVQVAVNQEFKYPLEHTEAVGNVVIACSEEVMNKPIAAFARWLKLDGPPIQVPSGHMLIPQLNNVEIGEEFKPAQRVVVELLKRATPKRIVLVAHTNCVYYDTVAAWQNNLSAVRAKQVEDLKSTAKLVHEWLPKATVELYLAEEENDQLVFHKI